MQALQKELLVQSVTNMILRTIYKYEYIWVYIFWYTWNIGARSQVEYKYKYNLISFFLQIQMSFGYQKDQLDDNI